eukprot:m.19707 g.19707  ORF g.19707 m.19707 type:complete len:298 (+) comp5477_c0_seq1:157-1050(+)
MAAVPSIPSTDGTHDQTAIPVVSSDASAAGAVGTGTPAEFFSSLWLDRDALQRLQKESSRQACVHCGKSRKFFCFDCHCLVGLEGGKDVPVLQLPIKVDIVKHWNERNSKSTAVHAKLVAPDQVTIHTFPEVPDLGDTSGTVLLYPCPDAVDIAAVDPTSVTRVVFVDSTWSQCSSILAHPTLAKLRRVQIASEHTLFWRPQSKKPSTHLATIEAIYHFFKQLPHEKGDSVTQYDGRFDNLLFWFRHQYSLIEETYNKEDAPHSRKLEASGFAHPDPDRTEHRKEKRLRSGDSTNPG